MFTHPLSRHVHWLRIDAIQGSNQITHLGVGLSCQNFLTHLPQQQEHGRIQSYMQANFQSNIRLITASLTRSTYLYIGTNIDCNDLTWPTGSDIGVYDQVGKSPCACTQILYLINKSNVPSTKCNMIINDDVHHLFVQITYTWHRRWDATLRVTIGWSESCLLLNLAPQEQCKRSLLFPSCMLVGPINY